MHPIFYDFMISINNVTVRFGGYALFNDISFMINPRDRIGLVGKNGAGKSTLLKILCGIGKPSEGIVRHPAETSFGYLPQVLDSASEATVYNEVSKAFGRITEIETAIQYLQDEVTHRTDYETESYLDAVQRLADLNEHLHMFGASTREEEIAKTLTGLGFELSDFQRPVREFSGGWRMRVELARILLEKPDVLLLDEPTNHLDIESIEWLESFLKTYFGAVVLISHDRAFLDAVTARTIEISLGKIYDYKASYTRYTELRKERHEQQMAAYRNQQKMLEDTQDFIERFRYKATKAVQVQSRIKQLEKIEIIEVEEEDKSAINLRFPPAPRSGTIVFEAKEISKSFGIHQVLNKLDFLIERGEKVAFIGRNGEGKSTFVKILIGQHNFEGELKTGHNVSIGYYAQNQDEIMDSEKTVLETIDQVAVGDIRLKIRDILGAFLFRGEDVDKKVKVLSGGERSRLAMALLLLKPYNLLILDEPTNHLDMRSKDILKQALLAYDGTLIVVSHDRDFLNGLTEKIYEFRGKKIKEFRGDIAAFLKMKHQTATPVEAAPTTEKQNQTPPSKQSYAEKKEQDKIIRKAQNQVDQAEQQIDELEKKVEALSQKMATPEGAADKALYDEYQQTQKKLESAMMHWERVSYELDILREQGN